MVKRTIALLQDAVVCAAGRAPFSTAELTEYPRLSSLAEQRRERGRNGGAVVVAAFAGIDQTARLGKRLREDPKIAPLIQDAVREREQFVEANGRERSVAEKGKKRVDSITGEVGRLTGLALVAAVLAGHKTRAQLRDIVLPDGSVTIGDGTEQGLISRAQLRGILLPDGSVTIGDGTEQWHISRAQLRDILLPDGSVTAGDGTEQWHISRAQLRDIVLPDGSVTTGDAAEQLRQRQQARLHGDLHLSTEECFRAGRFPPVARPVRILATHSDKIYLVLAILTTSGTQSLVTPRGGLGIRAPLAIPHKFRSRGLAGAPASNLVDVRPVRA